MSAVLTVNDALSPWRNHNSWTPQSGMFRYVLEEIASRIKDKSPELAHSLWETGHYETYGTFENLTTDEFQLVLAAVSQMFYDSFTDADNGDDLHNLGILCSTMILDSRSGYHSAISKIVVSNNLIWTGEKWIHEFLIAYLMDMLKIFNNDIYIAVGATWLKNGITDWSDLDPHNFSALYTAMKRLYRAYDTPRRTLSGSDWFLSLVSKATNELYDLFMSDPRAIQINNREPKEE